MQLGDHPEATEQLRAREPIFHHAQAGSGREVFEAMIAMDYWKVGASGRVYTRDYVIETLVERYSDPCEDCWAIADFKVRCLADDLYLATCKLDQPDRRSRRSTIWRRSSRGWIAEYHQGTLS